MQPRHAITADNNKKSIRRKMSSPNRPLQQDAADDNDINNCGLTFWHQGRDVLPIILSYLPWNELVTKIRRVNRSWREAVRWIPVAAIMDDDIMWTLSRLKNIIKCIPKLQRLRFQGRTGDSFVEKDLMLHQIATGWKNVKHLELPSSSSSSSSNTLQIPSATTNLVCQNLYHLTYLDVSGNASFAVDLANVARLTNLEVLNCQACTGMRGSLSSLATIGATLRICDLQGCPQIAGYIRDLATPDSCLELLYLGLGGTSVTGTLAADIQEGDFPSLIYIDWIHGGAMDNIEEDDRLLNGKELAFVAGAPDMVRRVFRLYKTLPSIRLNLCKFHLSKYSPNFYSKPENPSGLWSRDPPFTIEILDVDGRVGWRWTNGKEKGACDMRWIHDDENHIMDSSVAAIQHRSLFDDEKSIYSRLLDPPTEEEHNDLMYKRLIQRRRTLRRQRNKEESEVA